MKNINLNADVKVRLTDLGRKKYKEYYQELINYSHPSKEVRDYMLTPKEEDSDGYCTFAIWELMQFFGKHIYLGCKPLFDMNILINEKDIENNG
jgi:ribosomal protein L5